VLETIHALDRVGIWTTAHASDPAEFVPQGAGQSWTFDPALIDGMLQSGWIWTRAIQGASTLPLGVKAVRRFDGDATQGPLLIQGVVQSEVMDPAVQIELTVFDRHGRMCYMLEEFRGQASARLNRLGGGWQGGERPAADVQEAAQ
jgi:hypothetical protein